jgi:fused signal recognition particle receptor
LTDKKNSWFARLKTGLAKSSADIGGKINGVFTNASHGAVNLQDLEDILIQSDLGVDTATKIVDELALRNSGKGISADAVRVILAEEVERILTPVAKPLQLTDDKKPHVILVVGVNGVGKTTTIGKLARQFADEGRKVVLAAGDTFRAAAIEQLRIWGERTEACVVSRDLGADAAALVHDAMLRAREDASDVLLVDTAGRLQNKSELMDELAKIVRVIRKMDATAPHTTLLVIDATTGQNAMQQVEAFKEAAGVTGLVMTKLDGTARGGILVAIAAKHSLPVHAIGVGEGASDLQAFSAADFARAISAG